jgi:hypothetical protein
MLLDRDLDHRSSGQAVTEVLVWGFYVGLASGLGGLRGGVESESFAEIEVVWHCEYGHSKFA